MKLFILLLLIFYSYQNIGQYHYTFYFYHNYKYITELHLSSLFIPSFKIILNEINNFIKKELELKYYTLEKIVILDKEECNKKRDYIFENKNDIKNENYYNFIVKNEELFCKCYIPNSFYCSLDFKVFLEKKHCKKYKVF